MAPCLRNAAELKLLHIQSPFGRRGSAAHAQPRGVEPQELQPIRGHRPVVQGREPAAAERRPGDGIAGAKGVVAAPTAHRLQTKVTGRMSFPSAC